jgi:hypothetical protein
MLVIIFIFGWMCRTVTVGDILVSLLLTNSWILLDPSVMIQNPLLWCDVQASIYH